MGETCSKNIELGKLIRKNIGTKILQLQILVGEVVVGIKMKNSYCMSTGLLHPNICRVLCNS